MRTLKEIYKEFKQEQNPTPEKLEAERLARELLQERYISRQKDKKLKSYQDKPIKHKYKKNKKHNKKHNPINKVAVTPPNPSKILAPIEKKYSYKRVTGNPVETITDVIESSELLKYGMNPGKLPFVVVRFHDGQLQKIIKYFADEDSAFDFIEGNTQTETASLHSEDQNDTSNEPTRSCTL